MITPVDVAAAEALPAPPLRPLVARVRAVAESPEMLAIRVTLPYGFVGLGVGIGLFMALPPAGTLLERFSRSFAAGFGLMSTLLVVLLTAELARRRRIPVVPASLAAGAAFALSLPYAHASSPGALLTALGSSGLFLALGVALVTATVVRLACARFGAVLGSLAGGGAVVGAALLLLLCGVSSTGVLEALIAPLGRLGDSLTALLIITLAETLLWTVGIHGPALLAAVVLPVYVNLQLQNTAALVHGQPLPHIVAVSTFLFVFPGGAGATLPLVLLLLRSKVRRARTVAYAALVPSIFNVNEPLMFGLPLVLNPILGAPFVLAPLALAVLSYAALSLGLVARPAYYIPSTVPFGVFFATRDWRSIVLIALNVTVAAAIYAPFVALFERHEAQRSEAEAA